MIQELICALICAQLLLPIWSSLQLPTSKLVIQLPPVPLKTLKVSDTTLP